VPLNGRRGRHGSTGPSAALSVNNVKRPVFCFRNHPFVRTVCGRAQLPKTQGKAPPLSRAHPSFVWLYPDVKAGRIRCHCARASCP